MVPRDTETDMGSTRSSVYIPTRLRELLDLDSQVEGLSGRLAAICDRYSVLVAECPRLSRAEWMVLLDVCNGWASWSAAGETLMGGLAIEVADGCRLNGTHDKWGLTREQADELVGRLHAMGRLETIATIERVERFWRRSQMGTEEAMRAAGIVASEDMLEWIDWCGRTVIITEGMVDAAGRRLFGLFCCPGDAAADDADARVISIIGPEGLTDNQRAVAARNSERLSRAGK